MTALAQEPPMPQIRAVARYPVYDHPSLGPLCDLSDNGPMGRNLKLGREREAKLMDLHVGLIYQYRAGRLDVPDPPVFQSGNGAPVSGYDVRASKRHKGEHSDGPGIAAVWEPEPPFMGTIRHYEAVVGRLLEARTLSENHLLMLEMVWRDGRRLERPNEDKPIGHRPLRPRRPDAKLTEGQAIAIRASTESIRALARRYGVGIRTIALIRDGGLYRVVDPEQTVAGQLQISNAMVRRMWAMATTTLYFELFGA